jgi:hypothetical protein
MRDIDRSSIEYRIVGSHKAHATTMLTIVTQPFYWHKRIAIAVLVANFVQTTNKTLLQVTNQ